MGIMVHDIISTTGYLRTQALKQDREQRRKAKGTLKILRWIRRIQDSVHQGI